MFVDNAQIIIYHFSDENVSDLKEIFNGNIERFRENVGGNFDGFDLGDSFSVGESDEDSVKVRVFKKEISRNEEDSANKAVYYVGPENLNSHRINFNNNQ